MIGIVVVSHSARLAEGVVELAREMAGPDLALEAAGGLGALDSSLGTSATEVLAAIERAWSGDGVLVLMDVGSAVLSAEAAVDLLPVERRGGVLLCEAPLVEGAVAAAAVARAGGTLAEVADEACKALGPKVAHLGAGAGSPEPAGRAAGEGQQATIRVGNPLGLHTRPIARLMAAVGHLDAEVEITNLTAGTGPASARSLSALATLGVARDHEILVAARGPAAAKALEALQRLAEEGFGEAPSTVRALPAPGAASTPAPIPGSEPPAPVGPLRLTGLPASPGIARGQARHLRASLAMVPDRHPADPHREWERLKGALAGVRSELQAAREALAARGALDEAGILDAQRLLLEDPALVEPARGRVLQGGRDGAAAWTEASEQAAARWRSVADGYLRERATDLTGLARRVAEHLAASAERRPATAIAAPGILIAADLSPGEAAVLDAARVFGVALASGGPTAHAAIVARAAGIPAVAGLGIEVLAVAEGAELLLDGEAGLLYVDPSRELSASYRFRAATLDSGIREARGRAKEPAVTRDGRRVEVLASIGGVAETGAALEAGADGVGLVRTELLFPDGAPPGEGEQEAVYREIAEALEGRPLVFRTFDIGGDKALTGPGAVQEANPFLGRRGIRYALAHPELLRAQIAAILRVAARRPVKVMLPMVSTVEELRGARAALHEERRRLTELGIEVPAIELGAMVEVPAAALSARRMAAEADFLSIGTNDLAQYVMAADRGNPALARLADYLHPAVLGLVRSVVEAAGAAGRPVGICGEAASDPAALPLLVGLGLTQVSAAPGAIPAVKQAIRGLDCSEAKDLADNALGLDSAEQVRALVAGQRGAGAPG